MNEHQNRAACEIAKIIYICVYKVLKISIPFSNLYIRESVAFLGSGEQFTL
jgi:hypothetical protein